MSSDVVREIVKAASAGTNRVGESMIARHRTDKLGVEADVSAPKTSRDRPRNAVEASRGLLHSTRYGCIPAFPARFIRDWRNINRRVIAPAVRAANALRAEGGRRRCPDRSPPHLPPHVHHADVGGGRACALRPGPGGPRGPDDHARDLRSGAQAPRPSAPRRSVRRADGGCRSVGRVDHHVWQTTIGRPRHARYAVSFRRIRSQKRATPESVTSFSQYAHDHRQQNLAICSSFSEPARGLEPRTPSLQMKCSAN